VTGGGCSFNRSDSTNTHKGKAMSIRTVLSKLEDKFSNSNPFDNGTYTVECHMKISFDDKPSPVRYMMKDEATGEIKELPNELVGLFKRSRTFTEPQTDTITLTII